MPLTENTKANIQQSTDGFTATAKRPLEIQSEHQNHLCTIAGGVEPCTMT